MGLGLTLTPALALPRLLWLPLDSLIVDPSSSLDSLLQSRAQLVLPQVRARGRGGGRARVRARGRVRARVGARVRPLPLPLPLI